MARLNTYSNDTNPDRLDRLAGTASEDHETKNYLVEDVLSLTEISDVNNLQNILDLKADLVNGLVPASQLPSFVDDVIEVANYASLPAIGETGKIYVTLDDNKTYRWSGSTYIEIKDDHAVWGNISGILSTQTDLQNALDAKGNLVGGNTWDDTQAFTGDIDVDGLVNGSRIATVNNNTAIGPYTYTPKTFANVTTAYGNYAFADFSLQYLTTGHRNIAIGGAPLNLLTTGTNNVAIGYQASRALTTGSMNVSIGYGVNEDDVDGVGNVSIGDRASSYRTTGSNNTSIGRYAGRKYGTGADILNADSSVFIGYNTRSGEANGVLVDNEIVIGGSAVGGGSNSVTLGNDSILNTFLKGTVVINGGLVSTSNGDINITPDGTGKILLNSAMRINANVLDASGNTPTVNDSVLVGDTNGQLTWKSKDDLNVVEGSGTFDTLAVWTNPTNSYPPLDSSILGDSVITQYKPSGSTAVDYVEIAPNATTISSFARFNSGGAIDFGFRDGGVEEIGIKLNARQGGGYYANKFRFLDSVGIGGSNTGTAWLDCGNNADPARPSARFYGGVIISNNPGGVQVDNTSMVIGAGNNDIVLGSDHCLIVGSGNQVTGNSDQSVAFGQGNSITNSNDAFAVGNSNTLSSSLRTQALGFNNTIQASSSFIAGGNNNISTSQTNIMVLGYDNSLPSGNYASGVYIVGGNNQAFGTGQLAESFGIGNFLTLYQNVMTLGFRNNVSGYPATNKNLGLGETKFVVGVGSVSTTNANALIITEGGVNGGSSGSVPQIPRIILPQQETLEFTSDTEASAGGIPTGALYRSGSNLKINFNETAASGNEGLARLTPQLLTASATGSGSVNPDYNLVLLSWTGGNGNYTLNLPLASANTHRLIRITTDGTLSGGAGDKIDITATGGETIDGAASFQISKQYEGLAIFSTGTEWIIVQAKAH